MGVRRLGSDEAKAAAGWLITPGRLDRHTVDCLVLGERFNGGTGTAKALIILTQKTV